MTSNTNNKSDQSETQLYEVLLCKKKDIIAIQEKLGINVDTNQSAIDQSKKAKTLDDSYGLLFDLVEETILILEDLEIGGNPILKIVYRNKEDLVELSLGEIYHLLLYLEEDISLIQENLGIDSYTYQEMAEEADKNAREYLQKFRRSLRRCSKCGNTEIHR